jgi:hypothetical protein
MTTPDQPLSPVLRDLRALVSSDGWGKLRGSPDLLVYIHPWPDDSVDTLAIRGETDALAERTNPAGEPIWRREGTLADAIDALRELPPPDAPYAPRLVLPGPATRDLWLPRKRPGR